jgi:aminoglycoside phosphotransferase (APT) family kinase protein
VSVEAEEVALLDALVRSNLPVPVVRHSALTQTGSYLILEHLPGQPARQSLQSAGVRWELSALAFTVARALVAVHALDWTVVAPWLGDPEALPEAIVDDQIDEWWSDWDERIDRRGAGQAPVLRRALDWLDLRRPVDVSLCLNHGDFDLDHVLLQDDDLSGIVDWDHALVTDAAYDLASLTLDVRRAGLNAADSELFLQAVFGAYLQSSPRSFGNLPVFTVARLLTLTLDALDREAEGLSPPVPLLDLLAMLEQIMTGGGPTAWRT